MVKRVKKINIGVIDPEKDTFGIAAKTRKIVEEAIAQTQSQLNVVPISETIVNSASQFTGMLLSTASDIMEIEEVEKNLTDKLKASGYTVQQIQSILRAVRSQLEKLAMNYSSTIKFSEEDIKKIISACNLINK
jgi:predicted amino acid-binding ACT domain protein